MYMQQDAFDDEFPEEPTRCDAKVEQTAPTNFEAWGYADLVGFIQWAHDYGKED